MSDSFGECPCCGFRQYFGHNEGEKMCPHCWNSRKERIMIRAGHKIKGRR